MRFTLAFPVALLVTVAVFLFMQSLIRSQQPDSAPLAIHDAVELFRPPPPPPEAPTPEPVAEQASNEQPVVEAIEVSPVAPVLSPAMAMPTLELEPAALELPAGGGDWSAPMGTAADGILAGQAVDAQGFVEVIPFNTRKPNVPELAWKNKISGWVLVAFNVNSDGNTRNIRVLDARPRGVFEEKVIAAVSDWQYSVRSKNRISGEVVMTQKIEIRWDDYPMNTPNVD